MRAPSLAAGGSANGGHHERNPGETGGGGDHSRGALRGAGSVLSPQDTGYDAARAVHNGLVDRSPALIVRARTTDDVVAALDFARRAGLEVSVRGGGHNVAGRAVTVNLSGDFLSAAKLGDVMEGKGEVTRAGGRIIYVRGMITANSSPP